MGKNRFYEMQYTEPHDRPRPVYVADVGHILQISGVLLSGNGKKVLLMLPGEDMPLAFQFIEQPTLEEWSEIVRAADKPEYLDELRKVWLRKTGRLISGRVQQKIFYRDGFLCVYCGRMMGKDVHMTIDHWIPLDLGGENNSKNYFSACKRCNKDKGNMHPRRWCTLKGLDYAALSEFLEAHG